MGLLGSTQHIYLSLKDDEWESSYYRPHLGLPLVSYEAKWDALRKVTRLLPPSMARRRAGVVDGPSNDSNISHGSTLPKLGADNFAGNLSLHGCLKRVLQEAVYPREEVEELTEITVYRLGSMYEADYLRKVGLQYPSITDIDASSVIARLPSQRAMMKTKTLMLLLKYGINTMPIGIWRSNAKSLQYLTLTLTETLYSWESTEAYTTEMASRKKAWYRFIYQVWQGHRLSVSHDQNVKMSRRAFLEAFKTVKMGGRNLSQVFAFCFLLLYDFFLPS